MKKPDHTLYLKKDQSPHVKRMQEHAVIFASAISIHLRPSKQVQGAWNIKVNGMYRKPFIQEANGTRMNFQNEQSARKYIQVFRPDIQPEIKD